MKITVLVDNNTYIDQYYLAEPAVSYYIECDDLRILFDTGYSDIYLKNAAKMNIDLTKTTHIILSHGHNDHTGGLKYLLNLFDCHHIQLIAHPDCFLAKYDEMNNYIGSPLNTNEVNQYFSYRPTAKPLWLSDKLLFLGEIPNIHSWEHRQTIGYFLKNDEKHPDYNYDDTALVYLDDNDGIAIITGCSHSGIGNIISYAQKLSGRQKISFILGGFHLLESNDRFNYTLKFLKNLNLADLYPAHCISLANKAQLLQHLTTHEVATGLKIEIS